LHLISFGDPNYVPLVDIAKSFAAMGRSKFWRNRIRELTPPRPPYLLRLSETYQTKNKTITKYPQTLRIL